MLTRAVIMVALLAAPAAQAKEGPGDLPGLLMKYRCPVVDRLQRIHDFGDPAEDRDRFLILALREYPGAYVQCVFHDSNTKILCEAASGFFLDEPRTMYLPASAIAALGRLGFSTDDSAGNFRFDVDIANPPDYASLAGLMLTALFEGYGADAGMTLKYTAPFAEQAADSCDAVS